VSRVFVIAEVRSPLAISISKAAGNDLDTAHAIPGSAIRGALAQHFLTTGSAGSAAFKELFLNGSVRFGDLRLNGYDVWPLSARSCKADRERHPVGDVLLTTAAGIPALPECNCGAKREQPRGWRFETKKGFEFPTVETRRVAHVEIDIETNGSRSGNFHSSRVICAGQQFEGWVSCSTAAAGAALKSLIGVGRELYIGRGRSRGQGRVALTANFDADQGETPGLEEFNRQAGQRFPELRDYVLFSCLLRSKTIVYDRWLLSRACLEAGDFGAGFKDYAPLTWCSRQVTISGWNAAAGLPKADVAGIAAGSCWLFAKRETDAKARAAEIARIAPLLRAVAARGIGERLAEGFGEVAFCEPFHWEKAIREVQA
jgi:hypothetical protein